ncbi:sensor domain-containing diguanylate cyclase [Acidihalobacter aeolianus]|uniref:sensor domain-containing diguanylate cyclase n=1 Tax=Acidihalobacter aeolianus TaxID=2792603 RepID=UPI0009F6BAAF|nr:HDOD domain-containing protein [Acidihalobacter aeolianus]
MDGKRFWRRSLVSALVARALAVQLQVHEPEVFFQAGVLQDIGQLVLEKSDPDLYADILRRTKSHEKLVTEETNVLGFDHAQVGAHLLKRWGISEKLCQAVRCSHHAQPQRDDGIGQLDNCVYLSRNLAEFWLSVDGGKVDIRAVAQETEALLGLTPEDFHQTQARIAEWIPQYADMFDVSLNSPGILAALLQRSDECELLLPASIETAEPLSQPLTRPRPVMHQNTAPRPSGPPDLLDERHLLAILKHEFEAARLGGWPLSVCRLSLDTLKEVRERQGGEACEKMQWDAAQYIRNQLRPTDFVSSAPKNGIALVLPGTGADNAEVVTERLRIGSPGLPQNTRFSIGVFTYVEDSPDGCGIEGVRDLLAAADRANYVARVMGGNRTFRYRCV